MNRWNLLIAFWPVSLLMVGATTGVADPEAIPQGYFRFLARQVFFWPHIDLPENTYPTFLDPKVPFWEDTGREFWGRKLERRKSLEELIPQQSPRVALLCGEDEQAFLGELRRLDGRFDYEVGVVLRGGERAGDLMTDVRVSQGPRGVKDADQILQHLFIVVRVAEVGKRDRAVLQIARGITFVGAGVMGVLGLGPPAESPLGSPFILDRCPPQILYVPSGDLKETGKETEEEKGEEEEGKEVEREQGGKKEEEQAEQDEKGIKQRKEVKWPGSFILMTVEPFNGPPEPG